MNKTPVKLTEAWANTKAAYRFFSNKRVSEGEILAGHLQAIKDREAAIDQTILALQDTTEFSFKTERPGKIAQQGGLS